MEAAAQVESGAATKFAKYANGGSLSMCQIERLSSFWHKSMSCLL